MWPFSVAKQTRKKIKKKTIHEKIKEKVEKRVLLSSSFFVSFSFVSAPRTAAVGDSEKPIEE